MLGETLVSSPSLYTLSKVDKIRLHATYTLIK